MSAIAHVSQTEAGTYKIHNLEDHLHGVANLAGTFASQFGSADWAHVAGLWHDLGKYSNEFQHYIKIASGFDENAHLEGQPGRVDHSTAGAIHAMESFGEYGKILAYLIAGHHAGLTDWNSTEVGKRALKQRLENKELLCKAKENLPPAEILQCAKPTTLPPVGSSAALWIRMLFSCLVDADFLDTEAFMNSDALIDRGCYDKLTALLPNLEAYVHALCANAEKSKVNDMRRTILESCKSCAAMQPGLFSLTVPTGGGKTLSSMIFAMFHAAIHQKKRIIYVIPYTSIVEQTADIFRQIFGDSVIEHHSNFDPVRETPKSRLACENWDAPIVVTTSVQFFESLFAVRTSRVRKIHNIVNSVVIFDEAQLMPPEYLLPIIGLLQELTLSYRTTIVLTTATQPALQDEQVSKLGFSGLKDLREIVPNDPEMDEAFKRVTVKLPLDLNLRTSPMEIANCLMEHETVLCIVNRRDECRELHQLMPEGTIHLSGLMCGEHKSKVIQNIKEALQQKQPIRVISTQLVEAGVDFDFPVVYRAMSGLDSLAQAAGRCNREGRLAGLGELIVFVPWKDCPRGHLRQAETACRQLLQAQPNDCFSPQKYEAYFQHLYWMKGKENLDKHKILDYLGANRKLDISFRTAADNFHIIDDTVQQSIFVRYGESPTLLQLLKSEGPERWLLRRLQRYSINIPRYLHKKLLSTGEIVELSAGFFAQSYDGLYHPETGFLGDRADLQEPEVFIV